MTDKLVLVPVEPTEEMLDKGTEATAASGHHEWSYSTFLASVDNEAFRSAWKAMIAAAPSPSIPEYEGLVERLDRIAVDGATMMVPGSVRERIAEAATAITHFATQLEQAKGERDEAIRLNNRYAWERDKAREERDAAERRSEAHWKPRLEAAEHSLSEAREALKPFAGVAEIFEHRSGNRPEADSDPISEWTDHRVGTRLLTVGDFRRAASVLKSSTERKA